MPVKLKLTLGAIIVIISFILYVSAQRATNVQVFSEASQANLENQVEQSSEVAAQAPLRDLTTPMPETSFRESAEPEENSAESVTGSFTRFELSFEAKENIEAVVYALVAGSEMPTGGYVDEFSCDSSACSIGLRLTTSSGLASNTAKIMESLNKALLSGDATRDIQIGLLSVEPDQSGEGVVRFETMERRPQKYKVHVDELTGAMTITTNAEAEDDFASD